MCTRGTVFWSALTLALVGVQTEAGGDSRPLVADEQAVRKAGIAIDDASLLEFFRRRTFTPDDEARVQSLIAQLGDGSFKLREKSSSELQTWSVAALPYLRQALKSPDMEVVRRSEECIRQIEGRDPRYGIAAAAAHLLAARKPAGAAEKLLGFLPFAENASVADEVQAALCAVALRDGKPDKALLDGLRDPLPARRSAAAQALCRACSPEQRKIVHSLLQDADLQVRLQTALVLAAAKEKQAVPVLIDLIGELPRGQTWQVEEMLLRLACEKAPTSEFGRNTAARRKARDEWRVWWRTAGDSLDLARIEGLGQQLGYTLLVMLDAGRVVELDAEDRPRFQIDGLQFPLDAQVLPDDHVLVAEHNADRVTERNRRGEIVWSRAIDRPVMAQRLPNGNTFIAAQGEILELDRDGKEVFTLTRPRGDLVMKAAKLSNGEIACITSSRRFLRMDTSGKELAGFEVNVQTSGGRIDILPSGRVIVPEMAHNRIVEYGPNGDIIWQTAFPQPVAAVRLPNGNTLVTGMHTNRAVELDRLGKEVREFRAETRVTRAFRR